MLAVCLAVAWALLQGALMLLFAWENARFLSRRLSRVEPLATCPPVRLIIPCRGVDPEMHANLRALVALDYPDLELCFVVESLADPAVRTIDEARASCPHRVRLVEAGLAGACGQKVHNLMCATRLPREDREILAFVDSDARPHAGWLRALVGRLASGKAAVVTGYRWYDPSRGDVPSRCLSALNNTVLGVMGTHHSNLVWGGSWATRCETFEQLGLPEAWQGSLSDDLIVSRLVREAGLKIAFEPHALVASPAQFNWAGTFEFARRQFLVVRNYVPRFWWFACVAGGLSVATFWGLALCAALPPAGVPRWLPLAGCLGMYALGVLRWGVALAAVAPYFPRQATRFQQVAHWNSWGWPLVALATWLLVASAAVGKQITWRGITYSMDGPNATRVLARPPAGAAGFSPQANETAPVAPQAVTGQVASRPSAPFPTSGSAGSNRRAA